MKNVLLTLMIAFALVTSHNLIAQGAGSIKVQKTNYIVLTKKVPQIKPIYFASKDMAKQDRKGFGEFHIVFCGKNIGDLTDKELMRPYKEMVVKGGLKLFACGFSLDKFEIDKSELPKWIEVVENGITYALKAKKDDYISIEL
ncbi:sulfur reduction protein DsrE [Brumimicrobium salinarum]|uniref:Sulfur reduction protein DsrE n=1 Tax=Brumimicrobium salinarum TaxID=2058658 RepID=A0A2I0R433_9FLAO|nr:sulfur reduction protein DsrE [Brumimicrobium salinarum]PKR81336.1 sulfur reduction protein DsrE [Brumimicrobium salinarum]